MIWGLSLHGWEELMRGSLVVVGVGGLLVGLATFFVVALTREELAEARAVSDKLRSDTARLTADNLALQTSLLPRHAGIFGINMPAPATEWFSGIEAFAGTKLVIQVVDDKEARNLANEIALICQRRGGWIVEFIDKKSSGFDEFLIRDGVAVLHPIGKPWTPAEPNQPWLAWARASEVLADALTKAGLSVGGRRVSVGGFDNDRFTPGMTPHFDPPLEGLYLQVGARPVAETIEWIKQGRPDVLGHKATDSVAAEPHK